MPKKKTKLDQFADLTWNDEPIDEEMAVSEDVQKEIDPFLKGKTKAQLIELIHEIAQQHPEMAQALEDRRQLTSGHTKTLVTRLRREIQEIGNEPGWQDYWRGGGYTPNYSGIRKNPNEYYIGTTGFQRDNTFGTALTTMRLPRPFRLMPRIERWPSGRARRKD